ncbi:hypothetical protein KKF61_06505 [Patescibacteria group bacterium]|nr:hypothetical protein [Patescibacteria group bacterium]
MLEKNKPASQSQAKKKIDKLVTDAKKVKQNYDELDKGQKRKLMLGIGGVLALLTTLKIARKIKKKRKQ